MGLALRLSVLRLWRGKFAFCCQLCALAAVMAPLLIILGLKQGVLTSMRENLLSNPTALEFWFVNEELKQADVDAIRQLPETAFALPRLHSLYAQVSVVPAGKPAGKEIHRLEATAEGDPLLARAGIPVPGENELVLSAPMARRIGVEAGSPVTLTTSRNKKREKLERHCTVTHVLPEELDRKEGIYAPLSLCMEVEVFIKKGQGSPGAPAKLLKECYAALVFTEGDNDACRELCQRLAINDINRSELPAVQAGKENFPSLPAGTWMLSKEGHGLTAVEAKALQELALEENILALPWNPPCEVSLRGSKGEANISLHSRLEQPQGDFSLCPAPEEDYTDPRNGPVLEVPEELIATLGGTEAELILNSPYGESRITCRLCPGEELAPGQARTNPQFAALCRRAQEIPARWNYHSGELHYPIVTHFSSMRLYARSLEDVEPLYHKLKQNGLNPTANLKVIRELLALEHALNTLYMLISGGAAIGAIFSVALSLFNAVENNRKHYAQLLIMGMKRLPLAVVPLFEGIITTVAAFLVSLAIFHAVSSATDSLFASAFQSGRQLCVLHPLHGLLFLAAALGVAGIAAIAATIRILRISPSESLREL